MRAAACVYNSNTKEDPCSSSVAKLVNFRFYEKETSSEKSIVDKLPSKEDTAYQPLTSTSFMHTYMQPETQKHKHIYIYMRT